MDYRSQPDPEALFWLIPLNLLAENVVRDPRNSDHVALQGETPAFDVGFHVNPKRRHTLITLGRGSHADITVKGRSISRSQCSFEIDDLSTGIVRLWDRSDDKTTHIVDDASDLLAQDSSIGCMQFQPGTDRRIVVRPRFNEKFEFGDENGEPVQFRLHWIKKSDPTIVETINNRVIHLEDSQSARTHQIDSEDEKWVPSRNSRHDSKIATPGRASKLRYIEEQLIDRGGYAKVFKAIDVDSGKFVAIKRIPRPPRGWDSRSWGKVRDEIKCMNRIKHRHVMALKMSQGLQPDDEVVEIIMRLKEGNLRRLIDEGAINYEEVTKSMLRQMLEALSCLDRHGFVHRDVKPENILYTTPDKAIYMGRYHFVLSDFGLSKLSREANSDGGTFGYYAPELLKGAPHTHKADVWSLFATIAFALNGDFRESRMYRNAIKAADTDELKHLKDMAMENPDQRASAEQMLEAEFGASALPPTPKNNKPMQLLPNDFTGRTEIDMLRDEETLDIWYPESGGRGIEIPQIHPSKPSTSTDSWNHIPTSHSKTITQDRGISRATSASVVDALSPSEVRIARIKYYERHKPWKSGPQNGIQKTSQPSMKKRSSQRLSQQSSS